MSVVTTAFSSELVKISESQKKDTQPSYLKAVVAGLPVVAAQAASDVPEGMIERGVQNRILKLGKLPPAGGLLNIGGVRFASRIGAGAFTTPLFVSGMGDIAHAKNKKDEKKGLAKIVAAGGVYAGLRGGIEAGLDSEYRHMPVLDRLKRVAGPKAFRGIASAAATGVMVGRGLRKQKNEKNPSLVTRYAAPAAIGAGMAGLGGLYEAGIAEGFRTPQARWRVGAKVGGKAVAGAAATLFLSELMKKVLSGKEKKAEAKTSGMPTGPGPSEMNSRVAAWAKSADTKQVKDLYDDLAARGAETSPSSRAVFYALHDELTSRGVRLPDPKLRGSVSKVKSTTVVDTVLLASAAVAPSLIWEGISSLPDTQRDGVLRDALDRLYLQNKIEVLNHYGNGSDIPKGRGFALPSESKIYVSKSVNPAELAHEIGHVRAGSFRKTLLQGVASAKAHAAGAVVSTVVPIYVLASSMDKSFATKQEVDAKKNLLVGIGAAAGIAQAPRIAEEAIASAKGMKYLANAGATYGELASAAARLTPAFATYAAPAVLPFAAAALIRRRANKEK